MKLLMLNDRRGSEDGFLVKKYVKGETYNVAHHLAVTFINSNDALSLDPIQTREDCFQELAEFVRSSKARRDMITNPATLIELGEAMKTMNSSMEDKYFALLGRMSSIDFYLQSGGNDIALVKQWASEAMNDIKKTWSGQ